MLLTLYYTGVTTPTTQTSASTTTTKATTTTTKATTTTTTTTKPTTTTSTTTPKPTSQTTVEVMTGAWTTESDPTDSQPHCSSPTKDIVLGLSAALNVILMVVIVVGVLIHTNRMPCMKRKKDTNKQDNYYYTHNTPGSATPETPTTYDAIEASQPQQQQGTYEYNDAVDTSKPQQQLDTDYQPVEDKHSSEDNGVISDQYLSIIDEPTTYENVVITAPEVDSPSQKSTPKPKPRLTKERSTDSYTEMYSYTAMNAPHDGNEVTNSLDATVPPPLEDVTRNNKGNHLYYNQDAISKSKSNKQHAQEHTETPSGDTDEDMYCNQSAFIRGK